MPLSFDELSEFPSSIDDPFEVIWAGGYPRIHDRQIPPQRWLADYVSNYLQRDVRQILNVGDLQGFVTSHDHDASIPTYHDATRG